MNKVEAPNWGGNDTAPKFNFYQPYSEPLDGYTVLTFGPHAGKKLDEVPAEYLLWYANEAPGIKNAWLVEYIKTYY